MFEKKKSLILIKLGGSVITDKSKPYTARMKIIKQLSKEIHQFRTENHNVNIIVGHGGGSFPHTSAAKYQTQKGFINSESVRGLAIVQNDAAMLNRIIVKEMLDAGENAISVQPSAFMIAKNDHIVKSFLKPIKKMIGAGVVPVPYGDVAIDKAKGCCILSTEEILNHLAKEFDANKIIEVSDTPVLDANKNIISEITRNNFESIKPMLGGSVGAADVTGGMLLKVEMAVKSAEDGVETHIINGLVKDNLLRSLRGENVGTRIH
ncbi:MAG: isopentenyl phosphate kinase [Candidatus Aenigmatarchaeota archaeon]